MRWPAVLGRTRSFFSTCRRRGASPLPPARRRLLARFRPVPTSSSHGPSAGAAGDVVSGVSERMGFRALSSPRCSPVPVGDRARLRQCDDGDTDAGRRASFVPPETTLRGGPRSGEVTSL